MTARTRSRPGSSSGFGRAGRAGRGGAPGELGGEVPGDEIPGDPEQALGDPESVARTICLRLLDQRARSRSELAEALTRRGVPDEPAQRVLDRFTEVGLIDDAALANAMAAAAHQERGLARRAVAVKLRRRGLADDVVAPAVDSIDADSERARARDLVERRQRTLATLPLEVQQRRLVALLARKGYPAGTCYEVVRSVLDERVERGPATDGNDAAGVGELDGLADLRDRHDPTS